MYEIPIAVQYEEKIYNSYAYAIQIAGKKARKRDFRSAKAILRILV